jgi:hypothetical protein
VENKFNGKLVVRQSRQRLKRTLRRIDVGDRKLHRHILRRSLLAEDRDDVGEVLIRNLVSVRWRARFGKLVVNGNSPAVEIDVAQRKLPALATSGIVVSDRILVFFGFLLVNEIIVLFSLFSSR